VIRPDARQVRSAYPLYGGIQDYLQRDQPSRGSITRREAKCRLRVKFPHCYRVELQTKPRLV
jgi:hypothetical protein